MHYPQLLFLAAIFGVYVYATLLGNISVRFNFPIPSPVKRIGCIDGLRGYLALSVLLHHFIIWVQITYLGGEWRPPSINAFNQLGAGSVALFFMITGLVFYPRILTGMRKVNWVSLYVSRFFRIMPLLIVSVIIVFVIIAIRTSNVPEIKDFLAAGIWVSTWKEPDLMGYADSARVNAGVLWSIRCEWVFYLAIVPVCALGMDILRDRVPSWLLPAGLFISSWLVMSLRPAPGYFLFVPLFSIGMLAYEIQRIPAARKFLSTKAMSIVAIASIIIGITTAPTPYGFLQVCLFGFFFICVASGNSLFGLLETQGALALGECSYGIYLIHGIVLSLFFTEFRGSYATLEVGEAAILLPLVAVLVVAICLVAHLMIERPAIAFGRALAKRLEGGQRMSNMPAVV
jgi:peptidoglycan/LPS O-acetylase OafA/YrhL